MKSDKKITLAEFLGWEEGKRYKCFSKEYFVKDNILYCRYGDGTFWKVVKTRLAKSDIEAMREAKPIEEKKYYLVNPEIKKEQAKYLNTRLDDGKIVYIEFINKASDFEYQTKFSKTDLETIKSKFPKTFSICEVVEVEDD